MDLNERLAIPAKFALSTEEPDAKSCPTIAQPWIVDIQEEEDQTFVRVDLASAPFGQPLSHAMAEVDSLRAILN